MPKTFVIDAGHGGEDSGTVDQITGMPEKVAAMHMALSLKYFLTQAGHKVYLTRSDDSRPAYAERVRSRGADMLISVHFDWYKGRALIYHKPDGLSQQIGGAIANSLGIPLWVSSKSPHGGLYIDRYQEGPAILWEVDRITNYKPMSQWRIAKAKPFLSALFKGMEQVGL